MESEIPWEYHLVNHHGDEIRNREPNSEVNNTQDRDALVSFDTILPDDLLERVLSLLPIATIIRSGSVCKRWYNVLHSGRYLWSSMLLPQKPWYFMFTCSESMVGYAYDPSARNWYNFELPCIEKSNWSTSSSRGLVCFMDCDNKSPIFVCNPITRVAKRLHEAPGMKSPDYSSLAISVDRRTLGYTIVVVKSKQVPDDFLRWDFSIHIYESETTSWVTPVNEIFLGWRGSTESVICDGILYCLIYSTPVLGMTQPRHGLIVYDLAARSSNLLRSCMSLPLPHSLTCARLMNLKDTLIMVGGIGRQYRPDIIKGIGIWEFHKKEWREVSRMPHKFFHGFGEFDEVFACSGSEDLVYIQSYGTPALLVFDMSQKTWRWSVKCPVTKRFPLQLFSGFCFEPRLEIAA